MTDKTVIVEWLASLHETMRVRPGQYEGNDGALKPVNVASAVRPATCSHTA